MCRENCNSRLAASESNTTDTWPFACSSQHCTTPWAGTGHLSKAMLCQKELVAAYACGSASRPCSTQLHPIPPVTFCQLSVAIIWHSTSLTASLKAATAVCSSRTHGYSNVQALVTTGTTAQAFLPRSQANSGQNCQHVHGHQASSADSCSTHCDGNIQAHVGRPNPIQPIPCPLQPQTGTAALLPHAAAAAPDNSEAPSACQQHLHPLGSTPSSPSHKTLPAGCVCEG